MSVAKRSRPPMKRTTSMTEFSLDLLGSGGEERVFPPLDPYHNPSNGGSAAVVHRKSANFAETTHFLRACSFCNHCLIPGHDIYMYRGNSAFCSLECRQRQMTQDEWKEKSSLTSKKGVAIAAAAAGGETVAAGM